MTPKPWAKVIESEYHRQLRRPQSRQAPNRGRRKKARSVATRAAPPATPTAAIEKTAAHVMRFLSRQRMMAVTGINKVPNGRTPNRRKSCIDMPVTFWNQWTLDSNVSYWPDSVGRRSGPSRTWASAPTSQKSNPLDFRPFASACSLAKRLSRCSSTTTTLAPRSTGVQRTRVTRHRTPSRVLRNGPPSQFMSRASRRQAVLLAKTVRADACRSAPSRSAPIYLP